MSKKVLVITPAFPPYQGSHTQRMLAITDALAESGIEVSVLTTEILTGHPGYNPKTLPLINKSIAVYRTEYGFLHKKVYLKKSNSADKQGRSESPAAKKGVGKLLGMALSRAKTALLIPDSMKDWYYPAIKYVKSENLISKIKPDYILSCSMPNTSHVIGSRLSKKYNVPLIMDYGDPWVYITNYGHGAVRFRIEKRMEQKYLSKSKLVSFSAKGAEKLYQDKFGIRGKTVTAMTGFDDWLIRREKMHVKAPHDGFVLTYGGALQPGVRDPLPAMKAVDALNDKGFSLKIRTDDVAAIEAMAANNTRNNSITVEGYIPFEDYYDEMLDADILVFFGNSTSDQLPGKIFNYLPARKLILYISNISGGEDQALGIVRDYGFFVLVKNSEESIKEGLEKAVAMLNCSEEYINQGAFCKYSTKNQLAALAQRIKDLDNNGDER